jgi:hypothetical protein
MSMPDIERYRAHVAGINLPQALKDEMILIVWRMMQDEIDRAYGTSPVQQILHIEEEKRSKMVPEHAKFLLQSMKEKRAKRAPECGGPR